MNRVLLLWSLLFLFFSFPANGCSPVPWTIERLNTQPSILTLSRNKHYLLQMVPSEWRKDKAEKIKDSYGIVYKASNKGALKKIYIAKELYPIEVGRRFISYSFFLTDDGETIYKLSSNDIDDVLIIYNHGEIVQSFSYTKFISKSYYLEKINKKKYQWATACVKPSWLDFDENSDAYRANLNDRGNLVLETIAGKIWEINPQGKIVDKIPR